MLAVACESSGQPLPQVSAEGHSRSSPVLCNAPRLLWLTVVLILSTKLQNRDAVYLCYQFKSETCRRRYLTGAMVLSFNRVALQLTAHATQDWLHATAMILLRSMNGHQTHHEKINK